MTRLARFWPFLVSAAVFALDRITKWLIRTQVSPWESIAVIPGFFSIVHTENRGAAFGILSESTSEWRTLFLIVLSLGVMAFITVLLAQPGRGGMSSTLLLRIGLALVLGGAFGNVYDRVHRGAVTDFLEFYYGQYQFPAFNVADSAITTGAGLLLLDMWLGRRRSAVAPPVGAENKHVSQTD
jgi:signal peptidase II